MKPALKTNYYDSEFTAHGKTRKRIYTNRGTSSGDNNIRDLASKEFNEQKKPIFQIEKVSKHKRPIIAYRGHLADIIDERLEMLEFLLDNARIF
jgi:hypothetical protein